MKEWRLYVAGFRQTWANANMELCKRLIRECDMTLNHPAGISVGERFSTYDIIRGKNPQEELPEEFICIRHEYNGKVIVVQDAAIKAN